MISLKDVQLSNARISSALPPHLICVFVGATSGIGEYSLKTFAKYANKPRIYFVGRSQESADRISSELKALNSDGEYYFIKADVSLIHNVDKVCQDIKDKEKSINLLFLCPGAMHMHQTSEGLNFAVSLAYYARMRFVENFLPLMQEARSLRRVVNVLAGTKEGNVNTTNWGALSRGHLTSITTLTLEMIAKKAPEVSFIHNYPGAVKTNLIRGGEGVLLWTVALVFKALAPFVTISNDECGERHTFLATSARFPPVSNGEVNSSVPLEGRVTTARGTDGKIGSGIYSIDSVGESANLKTEALLAKLRKDKVQEAVWKHVQEEFSRIIGK